MNSPVNSDRPSRGGPGSAPVPSDPVRRKQNQDDGMDVPERYRVEVCVTCGQQATRNVDWMGVNRYDCQHIFEGGETKWIDVAPARGAVSDGSRIMESLNAIVAALEGFRDDLGGSTRDRIGTALYEARELRDHLRGAVSQRDLQPQADAATERTAALERQVVACPDAPVCQSCPCADEDDVCFPGERLRAEVERLRSELQRAVEMRENANAATLRAEGEVVRLRDALRVALVCLPDEPHVAANAIRSGLDEETG